VALRKAGKSAEESARTVRNMTVDFAKKGEMGAAINSLYAFFNAGTQRHAPSVRGAHLEERQESSASSALRLGTEPTPMLARFMPRAASLEESDPATLTGYKFAGWTAPSTECRRSTRLLSSNA
jgi:hypothetical protein